MLLLKDAIMKYELECKVRRLAEGTINNYDRHLRYLRDYLEAEHNVVVLEEIKPLHLKRFLLMNESNELHVMKSPLRIIAGAFFMTSSSNTYLLRYLEAEFRVNQMEGVRTFHIKQFLVDMADKGRKPQYINDLLKGFSRKSVFTSAGP